MRMNFCERMNSFCLAAYYFLLKLFIIRGFAKMCADCSHGYYWSAEYRKTLFVIGHDTQVSPEPGAYIFR